MKKITRKIALALVAAGFAFAFSSCSDGSDEEPVAENPKSNVEDSVDGNEITFNVNAASTNAEKTVLLIKYDRSAAGADELVKIENAEITVTKNGTALKTIGKIEFALDEYGSSFSGKNGKITDSSDMKEYKAKISIGATVASGDKITVKIEKGKITGAGAEKVKFSDILVALVDIDPSADYYKELCANTEEYKPLVSEKPANEEPKNEEPKNEEPKNEEPKSEEPKSEEPKSEEAPAANEMVFNVTEASTNNDNTVLLIKYDRSAAGAEELVTVENAEITVTKNGTALKTIDKIEFALDEYGSSFSGKTGQLTDTSDRKEYKAKISIGATVAAGDVIKVTFVKGDITGAGSSKIKASDIQVALVDVAEAAGWYKELCENEYKPIVFGQN
ncbi:hypothetical protein [Treponema saccharophilum]|uniref:Lipoprotein n=1 Tax=Treponema saccharophilum DSM 2985 TaxID=907348 RepID=H7EKX7_9SPIR|nr:hypothetical protein [Treponema saccharophilum]EIC01702.1 hypothetical protein TresaDRAFT_0991 [Treponema saccharophilum DSM 2985]BDC97082.1 hypothetical protein TRSA_21810 [Treponema saccharophilum]